MKLFKLIFIIFLSFSCSRSDINPDLLYFRLGETPKTIDPAFVVDVTEGELAVKIFSGLVRFDDNLQIIPELSESFIISNDGLSIDFTLKKDLKFSDGSFLNSSNVLYSWKRILNPDNPSPRKWVLENIKGAKDYFTKKTTTISGFIIKDDLHFKIILEKPFSPFLSLLTMPAASIVKEIKNDNKTNIIGAGPYVITQFQRDQYISIKPNKYYYSGKGKRPDITFKIIPEDSSAVAMMTTKELDMIKIPRSQINYLKKQLKNHSFSQVAELNTYYLGFNHKKDYLDINFKKACNMAINKQALINAVFGGNALVANTPIPPSLLTQDITSYPQTYNPEKAKDFLIKSKASGKKLIFMVPSRKESISVAVIIQDQLKQIGVSVELKISDWSAFKDDLNKGKGDLFYLSWWADYADAENFIFPTFYSKNSGSLGNRTFFINHNLDTLITKLQLEFNQKKKNIILNDIINILSQELPWIPLCHRTSVYAISKKVAGFKPKPMYSMDKGLHLQARKS